MRSFYRPILLLLTIFLFVMAVSAQADDDEVIRVDSSIVVLNASVTDADGKAVHGLRRGQFHVFEDGSEQEIKIFEAEESPYAAVVLLDASGSMEERMVFARGAAIEFLSGLRLTDLAAIYKFDSKVELMQDFSNRQDLTDRVFDLKANGMTVLNDAVFEAAAVLSKRPEKRRAIIVLSDGADTKSGKSADKALKAALLANAMIYTVDMSLADDRSPARFQNQSVLKNFAERSGGSFVATPGGFALREAFARIAAELGTQYTIAYNPSNIKQDGKWRAIEVRISRPNLTIRSRKGYNAPKGR